MGDPRTLVKSRHYIDLPGESPKAKLWPGVNNIIQLRKHRDVVFDIKLNHGATYTIMADQGRFYDPKRGLNVTSTTFQDGEPCHLWLGRYFQGSLVLKQGDKELSRYPIGKMDCTQGCRDEDPSAKPAPMLFILHDDKAFAQELLALETVIVASMTPASQVLSNALERARSGHGGLQTTPFGKRPSASPSAGTTATQAAGSIPPVLPSADDDVLQMLHVFGGIQVAGTGVPEAVTRWVAAGGTSLKLDSADIITRNWILGQMSGVGGYFRDALKGRDPWLKQFWNRAFILERSSAGKFVVMFSTSIKEKRNLGFLLGAYRTVSHDSRVMTIAGGAGSLSASGKAAWSAAKSSIKGGAGMAVAFTVGVDCITWWGDYNQGKKDFTDLAVTVGIDLVKAGIVAAATSAAVSVLVTGFAFAFGITAAPILAVAIGTVFILVAVGYAVDWTFSTLNVSGTATNIVRGAGKRLESDLPKDYANIYIESLWKVTESGAGL
ncbi:hypothetical protein ACU4HD_37700 [Cupriavidus basilensis]